MMSMCGKLEDSHSKSTKNRSDKDRQAKIDEERDLRGYGLRRIAGGEPVEELFSF